jgi:tetratricopeptide (TPR) repeat protein
MRTTLKLIGSLIAVAVFVGCATTSQPSKLKTSKEAELYLKGVHSQVVKLPGKAIQCKVESQIQEKNWTSVIEKANACVTEKQYQQVERYGHYLAKEHHMGPWGAYFLSLVAESRGELDQALWMIELALKKTPSEGLILYQKARLMHARGEFGLAVSGFEEALKSRSDLLGARLVLGQIYYRDQDFEKAKGHFKAALELDSKLDQVWAGLAECELEDGNGEAALVALEKAIDLQPKDLEYRMRKAHVYEKVLQDPKQALSAYQKIQSLGQKVKLNQNVTIMLNEKIKQLKDQLAKAAPGEQVSKRSPAKEEGVSK